MAASSTTTSARARRDTGLPGRRRRPIETPLPPLDAVSEGCDSFETPTVSFLVGHDGQTYYVDFEPSTTCPAADAELYRWILCWTYEPARCGGDPELSTVETAVEWAGGEGGSEPPCDLRAPRQRGVAPLKILGMPTTRSER